MDLIHLDFRNRFICIQNDEQLTLDKMKKNVLKRSFFDFFNSSEDYMMADNITLDFENEKLIINYSIMLLGDDYYDVSFFEKRTEHICPLLKENYEKILSLLGYVQSYRW